MKIIIVQPELAAEVIDYDFGEDTLSGMQNIVKGRIAPIDLGDYGYKGLEYVTLYVNDDSLGTMPFTRAIQVKHNEFVGYSYNDIVNIACGPAFFIGYERGKARALTEDEKELIMNEFGQPQALMKDFSGRFQVVKF